MYVDLLADGVVVETFFHTRYNKRQSDRCPYRMIFRDVVQSLPVCQTGRILNKNGNTEDWVK